MNDDINIMKINLIWDEYKYRHEHCWKLIFQITTAVVFVSIVPYTNERIAISLGILTISLPVIGIFLTIFSILRVKKELVLWKAVRDQHISLQNSMGILENKEGQKSTFKRDVLIYLIILLLLGIVNCFAIILVWIPFLRTNTSSHCHIGI